MSVINTQISRRQFVVATASAAGGLAISVALGDMADAATIRPQTFGPDTVPNEINAFLAIEPDGSILIRSPHNEMGQGAITALPMIVAEELECDWSKVNAEYADGNRSIRENNVYQRMSIGGSACPRKASARRSHGTAASAWWRSMAAANVCFDSFCRCALSASGRWA